MLEDDVLQPAGGLHDSVLRLVLREKLLSLLHIRLRLLNATSNLFFLCLREQLPHEFVDFFGAQPRLPLAERVEQPVDQRVTI